MSKDTTAILLHKPISNYAGLIQDLLGEIPWYVLWRAQDLKAKVIFSALNWVLYYQNSREQTTWGGCTVQKVTLQFYITSTLYYSVTILSLDLYEVKRPLILEKDRLICQSITKLHKGFVQGRKELGREQTVSWEIKDSYSTVLMKEPWLLAPLPLPCSSTFLLVHWSHDFFPHVTYRPLFKPSAVYFLHKCHKWTHSTSQCPAHQVKNKLLPIHDWVFKTASL